MQKAQLPARSGLAPIHLRPQQRLLKLPPLASSTGNHDITLLQWLLQAFPELNLEAAELLFQEERLVDPTGKVWAPTEVAERAFETGVYFYRPLKDEIADPPQLQVLGQGKGWIAVDKPPLLATIPRGSFVARTVTVMARRQFQNDQITPVHRLDRLTRGVILLSTTPARTDGVREALTRQFAQRTVGKRYRAVVGPALTGQFGQCGQIHELYSRIEKIPGILRAHCHAATPAQANAITRMRPGSIFVPGRLARWAAWQVPLRTRIDDPFQVVELKPLTGKTHQLRVQLAALGSPIVGDPLYGGWGAGVYGKEDRYPGLFPLQLLAERLNFIDPTSGREVKLETKQVLELEQT